MVWGSRGVSFVRSRAPVDLFMCRPCDDGDPPRIHDGGFGSGGVGGAVGSVGAGGTAPNNIATFRDLPPASGGVPPPRSLDGGPSASTGGGVPLLPGSPGVHTGEGRAERVASSEEVKTVRIGEREMCERINWGAPAEGGGRRSSAEEIIRDAVMARQVHDQV